MYLVYRPRYNVTYNRFFVLFFIGLYCYRLNNQCVTCCAERGTATNSTATDCCHCHPETGKRKHDCNRTIDYNKHMTLIKSSAFHGCLSVRVYLKKKTRIDVKTWCRKVFSKKIHHPPSQPMLGTDRFLKQRMKGLAHRYSRRPYADRELHAPHWIV